MIKATGGRQQAAWLAAWLLAMMVISAPAFGQYIELATITRGGGPTTGATGSAISGRAPLSVIVDMSGTTVKTPFGPADCTDPGSVLIRFDEVPVINAAWTESSPALTLTKTDAFTNFSWEKVDCGNFAGATWTDCSGVGDTGAWYHDGTGIHGKPVAIKLNNRTIAVGTLGSLANEQWAFGDVNSITANRIYVQTALTTPTVHAIYGDGTHMLLDGGTGVTAGCQEIDTKTSDDAVKFVGDINGGSGDVSDIDIRQAMVSTFTDLRFESTVVCTGGVCIEDITNGDQRPTITTAINEASFRGPIAPFVFKEGFTQGTITVVAYDDCSGEALDTQDIVVTETTWSGSTIKYLSSAGSDSNLGDDATAGGAWLTWEKGLEWLDGATAPAELVIVAGETIDHAGTVLDGWTGITGDRRIRSSVAGTAANLTVGNAERVIEMVGACSGLRIMDLSVTHTGSAAGGGATAIVGGIGFLMLRTAITTNGSAACVGFGTGGASTPTYDAAIYDCDLSTTGGGTTNGVYPIFAGGSSTAIDISRRAIIGCNLTNAGGEHVCRNYSKNSVWAYNHMLKDVNTNKTDFVVLTGSGVKAEYLYIARNYLPQGSTYTDTSTSLSMEWESGGAEISHVLIEENYIEDRLAAADSAPRQGIAIDVGTNILIRNNVIDGTPRVITHNNHGGTGLLRVFNNTIYVNKATSASAAPFALKTGTTAGFSITNLKWINNAMYLVGTSSSNYGIENNGANATLESTQIIGNLAYQINASGMIRNESATSEFDADDGTLWTTRSMKAAQVNIGGRGLSPLDAVDPLFANASGNDFRLCTAAGAPHASCTGASPGIDAGRPLSTVIHAFDGTVRGTGAETDIGAFDEASSASSGLTTIQKLMLEEAQRKRDGQ